MMIYGALLRKGTSIKNIIVIFRESGIHNPEKQSA